MSPTRSSRSRGRATAANTVARTGQKKFPWIEVEDGTVYRKESKDMAETIKSGRLESKRAAVSPT
ncbi:MAG TPA: hypothetical protein VNT04_05115 [Gaiellaceae bacterium]|nr:hypothetical protein [Gaiellaceae bacterium]